MGQPVIHFEIVGKDPQKLQGYYGELFGWECHDVPGAAEMSYKLVDREDNVNADGVGIAGGIGGGMDGYDGHVTFYVEVPDIDDALARAESLGGSRRMGPDQVPNGPVIAQFEDPEGHVVGLVQAA
jgi:predicted enzyme related to lactoylglutathione lyase